jgi:hypothetical protein
VTGRSRRVDNYFTATIRTMGGKMKNPKTV